MAITSVTLTQEGTGLSGSGISTDKVRRNYSARYRVTTDSPETSSKAVEQHFKNGKDADGNALPYYGRTWKWYGATGDRDVDAICNKFEVSHQPLSYGVFMVEVGFEPNDDETKEKKDSEGKKTDEPDKWHDQINVGYTQITLAAEKAIFEGFEPPGINNRFLEVGADLTPCNSAMVPFDPPLEELVQIKVIRISKYVADINDADDWNDYINDRDFTIDKQPYNFRQVVRKWQGWLKHVGGTFEIVNDEKWWKRDVELWINKRGWVDSFLDKGLHQRTAEGDPKPNGAAGTWSTTDFDFGDPRQQPIKGKNGIPIITPVLLDGNGQPLKDLKKPVFLKWRQKQQKNLALFGW